MENTCSPENCKLYDLLGGDASQCPNYVETWWTQHEGMKDKGQPILVKDCAPKRTMMMVQQLCNQVLGVQQAAEQQRNKLENVMNAIGVQILLTAQEREKAAREALDVPA